MKSKSHKGVKQGTGKPRSSPRVASGPPPAASAALVPRSSPDDSRASEQAAHATDVPASFAEAKIKAGIVDTGIPLEDEKKQWWKRPPNSKAREHANKIAVMDAAGHKDEDIARRLGMTPISVRTYRYLARKNKWWGDDDYPIDIEAELALNIDRKIVRNISASLDGQMTNWQTHEMTIAAAKGRGHFRNHDAPQQGSQALMPVAIQIIMPDLGAGDQRVEIPESMVGGVPAYVEGSVVE